MNEEIIDNVNKRLDEAIERGRQLINEEELPERMDELRLQAEELIRKHPLKSIATGLIVGFIVGKIIRSD